MKYYNTISSSDGCIYSLDNIRIKFDFGDKIANVIEYISHLAAYNLEYKVKYWHSYNPYGYVHQFTIYDTSNWGPLGEEPEDVVSFTVMLCLGNVKDQTGLIDFNPNKCEGNTNFKTVLNMLRLNSWDKEVVRYDIAIDIPCDRSEVSIIRDFRKSYKYIVNRGAKTEYLGSRSAHGFVKLYDKTKESNLPYPLTRLELTIDRDRGIDFFPDIRLRDPQLSIQFNTDLCQNDQVLVELIRGSPDPNYYMNKLTFRKRKKIEPYLGDKTLLLDEKCATYIKLFALSYE